MRSVLARQATTGDGTFLLRPENGPWRQGVSVCRVIFTYLAHKYFPSDGVAAWTQADYYRAYPGVRLWKSHYNWYSPACRTNVVALKAGETLPTSRVRFEPVSEHR